jgi:hypothetical protein
MIVVFRYRHFPQESVPMDHPANQEREYRRKVAYGKGAAFQEITFMEVPTREEFYALMPCCMDERFRWRWREGSWQHGWGTMAAWWREAK